MSFSYDIKTKLGQMDAEVCEFCKTAELYGVLKFSASFKDNEIKMSTEHIVVAERLRTLISELFGVDVAIDEYNGTYRVGILGDTECDMIYQRLFLDEKDINHEIMPFDCCRLSYLRGAFLGGGSISDPQKSYHMEFDTKDEDSAKLLVKVLENEGVTGKITKRKNHYIIYLKGYEDIASIVGAIGAGLASMEIYNISIEKEIRNSINRRMNCESANTDKVVKAYGKHMMAIEKIEGTIGLENLPEVLREIARVRLEYPDESLKELGQRLENPIGKSGVNHRLNRLIEIAEKL